MGLVEHIVFRNDENGYTVCSVIPEGGRETVTVVGSCAAIWSGERLRATGKWTQHKNHGRQFQAEHIECMIPSTATGIERYLASGLIKGIGKVIAQRLVKAFGDKTLHIIEKESARLREVEGIGPMRREEIKTSWNAQKAIRDIMIFLHGHGVGSAHAMRIYRHYGPDAVAVVSRNPYRLSHDIWGIGFKTADRIAAHVGIPKDSPLRARAGVVHLMETLSEEGHCYCTRAELIQAAQELLEIPEAIVIPAIDHTLASRELIADQDHLYAAPLYQAEVGVAQNLKRMISAPYRFPPIQIDKAIAWASDRMKLAFAAGQTHALQMALSQKVSIITGGPGVGKTTIVRALVDVFKARRLKIQLAAPTGRAAKRLEEATGREARTLHRLLKYDPKNGQFLHGPAQPLDGDIFIFDEVSMIDLPLMHSVLSALPDHAVLVLVGDTDQLPSVGPGNVLRDIIESERVPATRLETIFRQGSQSWIVVNAHHVNSGEFFELPPRNEKQPGDFFFIEAEEPEDVIQRTLDLLIKRIPQRFGFNPGTDIQVLTPMRRNQLGSVNLNAVLQNALNAQSPGIERFGRAYRVNDRVLQIRNNYDKEIFNGDIGIIRSVDPDEQELIVDFDGQKVTYDFSELDELDLAYACSIHKSQGSEYPAVIVLMATQHYKLLQRNLLYTAITRGRKLVCVIGSSKALRIAIHNNQVVFRRTGLRERIRQLIG